MLATPTQRARKLPVRKRASFNGAQFCAQGRARRAATARRREPRVPATQRRAGNPGDHVLPPGVALQQQIQMQTDPNIESAGLDPSLFGMVAQTPPRRLFQRGARSLQWQAEDRNGDTLEYAVYYRALARRLFAC